MERTLRRGGGEEGGEGEGRREGRGREGGRGRGEEERPWYCFHPLGLAVGVAHLLVLLLPEEVLHLGEGTAETGELQLIGAQGC